jgi:glucosyl-3-phosphoglycerate phosphatase
VLAAARPATVVTSDLSRARDTAAVLAAAADVPLVLDPRLRELDLGGWQGLTTDEARRHFPDEYAAWRTGVDVPRGGGETYFEAGTRAAACVVEASDAAGPGSTVVGVTHGGTARGALGVLLDLPVDVWWRFTPLGNCSWSVLVEGDRGWRLERHGVEVAPGAGPPAGALELGGRADVRPTSPDAEPVR